MNPPPPLILLHSHIPMNYYFAPIQGNTDAAYRHFHATHYGMADHIEYTTPFIRLEKGELRKKDIKDVETSLNESLNVVPQVIFRNKEELATLVELLRPYLRNARIDINMGCPFPLQTSKGRGAASVGRPECIIAVKEVVEANPDISFSVKMRLGYAEEEYEPLLETLNTLNLDHISVHPRTSKEQYSGDIHQDAFSKIYEASKNPVVYNGDLRTPQDVADIVARYPNLHGVMIGRGALARPSIFNEIVSGEEWELPKRRSEMLKFHRELYSYYQANLIGGDHQVLDKIKPFWEYAEEEIGRKAWKGIKKASNISGYQTALAII